MTPDLEMGGGEPPTALPTGWSLRGRTRDAVDFVREWVFSDGVSRLAREFGLDVSGQTTLDQRLDALISLSASRWDLRTGAERWRAKDIFLNEENLAVVQECVEVLGMRSSRPPTRGYYDFVAVLGGGLDLPQRRIAFLQQAVQRGLTFGALYLLGSNRALLPEEVEIAPAYAADAETEFDMLDAVLRHLSRDYTLDRSVDLGPNRQPGKAASASDWRLRVYTGTSIPAVVLAAPHPASARRATTVDTLRYFAEVSGVGESQSVLVVSTSHFAAFQHAAALRWIGVDHGATVETCWHSVAGDERRDTVTSMLLEVRSALLAMRELIDHVARLDANRD